MHRPSYAAVVAHVALAVALSGGAMAAVTITGAEIKKGSVTGANIKLTEFTVEAALIGTTCQFIAKAEIFG